MANSVENTGKSKKILVLVGLAALFLLLPVGHAFFEMERGSQPD